MSYEERKDKLEQVELLLRELVRRYPGLSSEELGIKFFNKYRYLPTIDNKLRHSRKQGIIVSIPKNGRLRWYIKGAEKIQDATLLQFVSNERVERTNGV